MAESQTKPQEQPAAAPQQKATVPDASPSGNTPRPCPKDCAKCSLQHQVYCATKMTFDSFTVMNAIIQRLDRQQQTIDALSQRIAAIQSTEAEFSSPTPIQGDLFPAE